MKSQQKQTPREDIALHPRFRENESALLHALLQATDYGVLVSGLDRQDILANTRLGELFDLAPHDIVHTAPKVVRALALRRVRDPQAFDRFLEQMYADPMMTNEDEVELNCDPARTLRRFTGPVLDLEGQPIGRLWTFLDITETKRLQAEVQAQLAARTQDYITTAEVLKTMNALCRVAVHSTTAEALLTAIVERVRLLVGLDCAAVLLLSRDGTELHGIGCPVHRPPESLHLPRKRDTALAQAINRDRMPGETPFTLYADHNGPISRRLRCRTIRVAPLCSEDSVIGVLVLGTREPGSAHTILDHYHGAHLSALVDQIALTLQTHRLQSELHAALETLKTAQHRMVEMEKLRTAGTLAASVAHDIRNILTAMQMELAAQPESVSESLGAQLNRFSALTHRLLAFSRPNVLETYPTSVAAVIRRMVSLVAGQAEINGVEIVVKVPARIPLVAADASQLEHLFINLCLNAIQAMTEQGGTLTLRARKRTQWLDISVEDTGCGIPPEQIARLFDPFFTTRANGLGLGLFSCKRIVEAHGGQLTVKSSPGKGTCFTVLLPTLPAEENVPT
jgi:signal transduction histidine kinase